MAIGNSNMHKISANSKLIFNLNQNLFTYSIFNTETNTFQSVKTYSIENNTNFEDNMYNIIQNDKTLKKKYKKTLGTIESKNCTFIPDVFFDKKKLHNYLHFNNKANSDNLYLSTKQQFTNCHSVFTINSRLEQLLNKSFNNLNIKSFESVFVDYSLHLQIENYDALFVHIDKNVFFLTLIRNKKLIFFNQFSFENNDEFLYYFMNCLDVLKLNASTIKLNIMSSLEKNHTTLHILRQYVKHIYFVKRSVNFLYEDQIMSQNEHLNHHLFSQIICE
tara:strand:- start:214 stop:1041 length:828 start_codon:yes stop_codon:yes gene_type:complete